MSSPPSLNCELVSARGGVHVLIGRCSGLGQFQGMSIFLWEQSGSGIWLLSWFKWSWALWEPLALKKHWHSWQFSTRKKHYLPFKAEFLEALMTVWQYELLSLLYLLHVPRVTCLFLTSFLWKEVLIILACAISVCVLKQKGSTMLTDKPITSPWRSHRKGK